MTTIKFEIPKEEVVYIINTAIEGAIGYWSVCHEYDCDAGIAKIQVTSDDGDQYDGKMHNITPRTVVKGIQAMFRYCNTTGSKTVGDCLGRLLTGNYDANDADVCIQFALFNDVVFG